MKHWHVCGLVLCGLFAVTDATAALPAERVSLEEALEIAASSGATVAAARGDVEVARADVVAANVYPYNPQLSVAGGPRVAGGNLTPDVEVGVGQTFPLGGRLKARKALAEAGVDVAALKLEQVRRAKLATVAEIYLEAVHAERRLAIAQSSVELAERLTNVAQRRFDEGETNQLEVNTAALGRARHDARGELWRASRADAIGRLRALLGLDSEMSLELSTSLELSALAELEQLLEATAKRADLELLRESLERERSRAALADAAAWPTLGIRLAYAREEGADVAKLGLAIGLPLFARGQGLDAEAMARTQSLSEQLSALEEQAGVEVAAALERYETLHAAEVRFRNNVLPILERNEEMVRQAYEAGAVGISDILAIQREMIEAREAYVDLLFETALANIRVRGASGTLALQEEE